MSFRRTEDWTEREGEEKTYKTYQTGYASLTRFLLIPKHEPMQFVEMTFSYFLNIF